MTAMPALTERFAFEGRSIAWGAAGSGPPLVLVHGTPFSSAVWRRIAPWFTTHRRVHVFDLAGYGASEKGEGQDVSIAAQGRLVAALVAHWQLEAPDVVAHDFGGAASLRAHLLHGVQFRSLTLIDAVALSPWGSPFVAHVRDHAAAFAGLPAAIHDGVLGAYLAGAAHRPLSPDALALYTAPWTGPTGQAAFYRQIAQMDASHTAAFEPLLDRIRCPATVVWGAEDGWLPVAQGRTLARRLGARHFVAVPEAGHLVQDDVPEALVAVLGDVLFGRAG
ncbi:alpha/beta fold hydrolase [Segnochrobactrum spirostomi]|uniref:Alpha/beta hydrolase n=1 Tax=Segnochrobactrum spirostomi TaxID=2608987 RepID=A0A6A7XZQ2_9HYPH|nr:alpha/beta hydrolase [Segnochrobactrum spirostomi]MQT11219.1 alpha/beta hydrolase [Segnochrobactrum spirostomi]